MWLFQLRRISKSWMLMEIMYLADENVEVQLLSFSVHQLPSIKSSLEVLHPRRGALYVNLRCYIRQEPPSSTQEPCSAAHRVWPMSHVISWLNNLHFNTFQTFPRRKRKATFDKKKTCETEASALTQGWVHLESFCWFSSFVFSCISLGEWLFWNWEVHLDWRLFPTTFSGSVFPWK